MAVIVSILAAVFVTVVSHQANAASAEDFYNGKTIRVVVGFAAGGGFDSYASSRVICQGIRPAIRR
jgi:tripartite-type tricarboxylate transporter receptor subunit TctC